MTSIASDDKIHSFQFRQLKVLMLDGGTNKLVEKDEHNFTKEFPNLNGM
jgi:hypothetical protein